MDSKVINNSRIYTDVQGIKQLSYEYKKNPDAVKAEAAKQFESFLLQMMLRSMRDANKALVSEEQKSEQMNFYQDMFDKQLALGLPSIGLNLLNTQEKNTVISSEEKLLSLLKPNKEMTQQSNFSINELNQGEKTNSGENGSTLLKHVFDTPEKFVKSMWSSAQKAAKLLGASPVVLIAQAALETNWGKKIIPHTDGGSSHNLFSIKADSSWDKKTTTVNSLEQQNDVMVKVKSKFRSYDSFAESFMDYVDFLKSNSRYNTALKKASNPKDFVRELQKAGYATDKNYASKILKMYSSGKLKQLINNIADKF